MCSWTGRWGEKREKRRVSRDCKRVPAWLGKLTRGKSPAAAVWLLVAVSCLVPFAGRTAIGWIVDVTTIGASVAYGYVSWCALVASHQHGGSRLYAATGIAGVLAAVAFAVYCLVPHLVSVVTFATDSYLILAVWGILGSLVFRHLLVHDKTGRLGKSTVVWLALLLLVFFASHMWVRLATYHIADDAKMNLMVLKALLKRLGNYDIAMASDGNEALEMLRHAGDRPFSLVLTDYWMPNLDGGGLVGAIRADPHLASIPVHVITADIELQAEYVSKGFDSLLLKPVTPDSLRPLLPAS